MAFSKKLVELLEANLEKVPTPESYNSLRDKLKKLQPTREAPLVKESPENHEQWGSLRDE
jgi:hypothetical protein